MSRLSMDLKVMPRSYNGHKYILCVIDEVTNYWITVPIFQVRSQEIGEALIENVITKYCIHKYIIIDQNSAFISSLMTHILHKIDIKIKTVAPCNHQSPQAEHGIKSLSHILTKHLTNLGQMWLKYMSLAMFTLLCNPNFFCSRIIGISIWALYISSTHLHLYKNGKTGNACFC